MQGYSLGCFTCRRRKVKCDERKPGCARCERRGEDCPGYRDRNEIVFRDMNKSAAAMAGHGAIYYRLEARGEASAQSVSGEQRTSEPLTLLRLSSDWEGQALTRFFHDYILLPSAARRGYLEFLPDLCVQNWQNDSLREALLAASMASFANISDLGQVRTAAIRHYGLALQSVRETLNDSALASSNSFLASIILLQKFEIISGNGASSIGPHDEALANLQDQRSVHDLMSPLSQSLSFAIQSRLYISELDGKRPNSSPVQHSVVRTQIPHHAALWQLFGSTARVCRRMRHLIASARQSARSNAAIQNVFQQMFAIHGELATWPMSVSEKDEFRSVPAEDTQGIDSQFPQVYLLFDSVQHCALWMSYWCIRLQFLEHMKTFIGFVETFSAGSTAMPSSGANLLDQLSNEQTTIVDQICGSAPYMLGDIGEDGKRQTGSNSKALGAFFLLRGLYVAMHVENASPVQIDYILDRLVQIGRSKGIAQALRGRLHWLATHPEFSVTI